MSQVTKAVIPVAGLGTRMLPATKAIPKEMLPTDGVGTKAILAAELNEYKGIGEWLSLCTASNACHLYRV